MAAPLPWVDVGDLLEATGARNLSHSGREWTFSCPGPNHAHGDATPSAGMNSDTSLWRCRTPACALRGNAADYLAAIHGWDRTQCVRVLTERYGGPDVAAQAGALQAEVERIRASARRPDDDRVAPTQELYDGRMRVDWPEGACVEDLPGPMRYALGRGFSSATLNEFGIGYDELSDRVTIPVHDLGGRLVGVKGRAWRKDQSPKYLVVGDVLGRASRHGFHTYHKSRHVFGAHRLRGRWAVVAEGELNAVALSQLGVPAVAVSGADFSADQAQILISTLEEAVIYFDGDAAGEAGAAAVCEALGVHLAVHVARGAAFDAADVLDPAIQVTEIDLQKLLLDAVPRLIATL